MVVKACNFYMLAALCSMALPAVAQERVYVTEMGRAGNSDEIDSFGTAAFIDGVASGTDLTPPSYSPNIVVALSPIDSPYPYLGTTVILPDGASPAGGNFVALPLYGQINNREYGFRYSDVVDAFGRPVELVDGQEYEIVFWVRPTLFQDGNGNRWYYEIADTSLVPTVSSSVSASLDQWGPEEWGTVTVSFVYDENDPDEVELIMSGEASLVQFSGAGANPPLPLAFLTAARTGQLDYGNILRLDTSAVVEIYPQVLTSLTTLPTLRQRLGRLNWPKQPAQQPVACKDSKKGYSCPATTEQLGYFLDKTSPVAAYDGRNPYWIRMDGSVSKNEATSGVTVSGYDLRSFSLQAGKDVYSRQYADGSVSWVDVTAHFKQATASLDSTSGGGKVSTQALGIGVTGTWLSVSGFYLDGQAQLSWATSDLSTPAYGNVVDGQSSISYALSVETGKRIEFDSGLVFTPQVQLSTGKATADAFTTLEGVNISEIDATRTTLRLGATIEKAVNSNGNDPDSTLNLYGLANLYRTLSGSSSVFANGVALNHDRTTTIGEIGIGFDRTLNAEGMMIYGEVKTAADLDSVSSTKSLNGSLGFSFKW
jgi:outer membrane autotransporter protein